MLRWSHWLIALTAFQESDGDVDLKLNEYITSTENHEQYASEVVNEMRDVCPAFTEMTIDWAIGGVMARPGLDLLTRHFVVIASCVTLASVMREPVRNISDARLNRPESPSKTP